MLVDDFAISEIVVQTAVRGFDGEPMDRGAVGARRAPGPCEGISVLHCWVLSRLQTASLSFKMVILKLPYYLKDFLKQF